MKIKVFGKKVSRVEAEQLIINDQVACFIYGANKSLLIDLLETGWKPLPKWSKEELEIFIDALELENQPVEVQSKFK